MSSQLRLGRAIGGVLLLVVVLAFVLNWFGDFRSATSGTDAGQGAETTSTAEPTSTPEAGEGEGAAPTSPAAGAGKTVVVLVDGLNFRSLPSRDGELIRGLDANEKLTLLGEESGWLKVKDSQGVEGYVSASAQYTRVE